MTRVPPLVRTGLLLVLVGVSSIRPQPAQAAEKAWLPDTFALARVDDTVIRVRDYVNGYFATYAEFRPPADSTGRVEFLNSMINKEVMARAALEANRPLSFEERALLRADTETALANTLFQRAVADSGIVTEAEVRAQYDLYKEDHHLQQIVFADRATADQVRARLAAGKLRWADAVRLYHRAQADTTSRADMGWVNSIQVDPLMAPLIFTLGSGQLSPVISDRVGHRVVRSIARRPSKVPVFNAMRLRIRADLENRKMAIVGKRLQRQVGSSIGIEYDSTNIAWASKQFGRVQTVRADERGTTIELNAAVPEFSSADTGRVLARHRDEQYTLSAFLHAYHEMSPMTRPEVNDFESFLAQVDAFVLRPYMSRLALERGLDKDPLTVATLARRREGMLVERMYEDSITARVQISPQQRRKYYEDRIARFHTFAKVRFGAIVRRSRASADSVVAALKAGAHPAEILRADSLQGEISGSIQERSQNEEGAAHHKILFGELRQGQSTIIGPDKQGDFLVLHVIEHDPGRQLSFEEAEAIADESLRNIEAERLLNEFIARRRRRHAITSHPERVMQVRLVDPTVAQQN